MDVPRSTASIAHHASWWRPAAGPGAMRFRAGGPRPPPVSAPVHQAGWPITQALCPNGPIRSGIDRAPPMSWTDIVHETVISTRRISCANAVHWAPPAAGGCPPRPRRGGAPARTERARWPGEAAGKLRAPRSPGRAGGVVAARHGNIDHAGGQLGAACPDQYIANRGRRSISGICRAVHASAV